MRRLSIPSRLGSALARRARGLRKFLKMTLQPEISPEPLRLGALLVQRVVRAKMLSRVPASFFNPISAVADSCSHAATVHKPDQCHLIPVS
jgi:hypothetical protein